MRTARLVSRSHEAYPSLQVECDPVPITVGPISPHGESIDDLRWTLKSMLADMDRYAVVEWSDCPPDV